MSAPSRISSFSSPLVVKKKAMSITQTYFLAHKARAKLSREADRSDHDLRLLVGHANLLDALMLDLADAEREQESWFNQSVRGAAPKKTTTQPRHVQWADTVVEEPEEDWQAEDVSSSSDESDSEDLSDDEDAEMADAILALARTPQPTAQTTSTYHDDIEEDDEADFAELALTRSPSHFASPPELDHDSDSSDDESMPPSPPNAPLPTFTNKHSEYKHSQEYLDASSHEKDDFYQQGYYLPPRSPARLVSAISVY